MMPGEYPLALYRGDTYHWEFTLWADEAKTVAADLSDATAKAEIRDAPGGPTIVALTCSIATNVVTMTLSAAASAALPATGVWDLQLTYAGSGDVGTVLKGAVTVTPDVTDSTVGLTAVTARVVRGVK